MNALALDLTELAALWMGSVLVLVPLAGLTARFAAVPVLDALTQWRRAGREAETADAVAARLARLEEELSRLAQRMERPAADDGRQAA